jgi:hypothetical protein
VVWVLGQLKLGLKDLALMDLAPLQVLCLISAWSGPLVQVPEFVWIPKSKGSGGGEGVDVFPSPPSFAIVPRGGFAAMGRRHSGVREIERGPWHSQPGEGTVAVEQRGPYGDFV